VEFKDGTKLRVDGILLPADQLNTDRWKQYDIGGVLSATAIEEMK
jgi:hypothetical protein